MSEKTQEQLANDHDISSLLGVIADIRHKTGVKEKPMLYELADAIKAEIDNRDKVIETTMAERDDNCDMADVLAHKISQILGVDIGEHSHLNDPWQNAVDYANAHLKLRHPAVVAAMSKTEGV